LILLLLLLLFNKKMKLPPPRTIRQHRNALRVSASPRLKVPQYAMK
jgi:hypothetical protein